MFSTSTRCELCNHVIVYHDDLGEYVFREIEQYYSGKEWEETVFLTTPCYSFDFHISNPITRDSIKFDLEKLGINVRRIIFLNLDHLNWSYYLDRLNVYLEQLQPDEIWEWQAEIYKENPYTLKDRVKFMPLRYVQEYSKYKTWYKPNHKYAFSFVGSLGSERRSSIINSFNYTPHKILSGHNLHIMSNEIDGFLLNIKGYLNNLREQLRISEALCLNIPVMTEKDTLPYYNGLVSEYNYDEVIKDSNSFFWRMMNEYEDYKYRDMSEEYAELTQSDEAYSIYKENILSSLNNL